MRVGLPRAGRLNRVTGGSAGSAPAPYVGTKAASLDGVDEYLTATSMTLNPATGFGFSCWALINNTTAEKVLLHCRQSGTIQFAAEINGSTFSSYIQRSAMIRATTGSVLTAGTWHHFASSVDVSGSNRVRVWVDGTLQNTATGTLTAGTVVGAAAVGRVQQTTLWYLNGKICDVAIWGTTLTDGNVTAMYNGGVRGDPEALSGLTATRLWPFQATDNMTGGTGGIADLKGGTALSPINTESGDLVAGP